LLTLENTQDISGSVIVGFTRHIIHSIIYTLNMPQKASFKAPTY